MKLALSLSCALLIGFLTVTAEASIPSDVRGGYPVAHIWFTAIESSGGGSIVQAGGMGQETILSCDPLPASCSWTIAIDFTYEPVTWRLASWAIDLFTREQVSGATSIVPGSLVYTNNNLPMHVPGLVYGNGPMLEKNANALDYRYVGESQGRLATFTLFNSNAASQTDMKHIYAVVGPVEWADENGDYANLQLAANAAIVPGAEGTDLGDVIKITSTPESATCSLLALAALSGFRRRNRFSR